MVIGISIDENIYISRIQVAKGFSVIIGKIAKSATFSGMDTK
jgi:hypothetical protein